MILRLLRRRSSSRSLQPTSQRPLESACLRELCHYGEGQTRMLNPAKIRPDHEMSRHHTILVTLADHWQVPASKVASLVGADASDVDPHMHLTPQQTRFLDCLREIDLTLLASYGTSRRWLKRRSKAVELAGKAPLDFLEPLDIDCAWTVLRLAGRHCAGLRRERVGTCRRPNRHLDPQLAYTGGSRITGTAARLSFSPGAERIRRRR